VLPAVGLSALSPIEVAAITVPLALYLMLAWTAIGTFLTTEALRLLGGLTPGFVKFMSVTSAVLSLLAFLVVLGAPVAAYREVLRIGRGAASWLPALQGLALAALILVAFFNFRPRLDPRPARAAGLIASAALLAGLGLTLEPVAGSWWGAAAIWAAVLLGTAVLGTATTGMLLGHWYLVTPALTNLPLLRSILWLLAALVAQAVLYPLALAALPASGGSPFRPLASNAILAGLWGLGAVALPLLAAALAYPACRIRSFMSATGLLYLAMIAIFPGQVVGQLLLFVAAA
jgi:hypothetical protein